MKLAFGSIKRIFAIQERGEAIFTGPRYAFFLAERDIRPCFLHN